jgi:uncharacterized membrane protein
MFIRVGEWHHRSFTKAITWRLMGSLDTLILSYAITGNFVFAGSIAGAESFTKVLLYYLHERTWNAVRWGKRTDEHLLSAGAAARAPSWLFRSHCDNVVSDGARAGVC